MNMAFEIDPVKYGVLWQKVEDYERQLIEVNKKMDKMEANLETLVKMAERSKGSLWALMGIASVVGGALSLLTDFFFKK
jgi:VIT1/CCC1 family predicted Fe2+/Mn2+ transporter